MKTWLKKALCAVLLIQFIESCQFAKTPTNTNTSTLNTNDYIDHLGFLTEGYLHSNKDEFIPIPKSNSEYLYNMYALFAKHNELVIPQGKNPKFHLIRHKAPVYFSMPNGHIFLSLGLMQKYIRHEGDLKALLASELIKSYQVLYPKKWLYPKASYSMEDLLELTRISEHDELITRIWAYHTLKRCGFDPYVMVIWLQQENKNAREFSKVRKYDVYGSKLEYYFKNFLLELGVLGGKDKMSKLHQNSSKEFYQFLHWVKSA